jgi:uncharacterized protein YbaR (Trm112 family)
MIDYHGTKGSANRLQPRKFLMDMVVCPHCKTHRIVATRVPKDVVAVMPCPACHELAVLFRNKVIGLSRSIIERGTFDERKDHLATVIAEFLEAGILPLQQDDSENNAEGEFALDPFRALRPRRRPRGVKDETKDPISQEEVERFTRIELKRLDNPTYFRRHFG